MRTYHVYPINDLIEHDLDDDSDCICGPTIELVEETDSWIYTHHSLDGREEKEDDESHSAPM